MSHSLRGRGFAHDPSGFRFAKATFGRSILPTREGCSPAPDGAPPIAAPAGRPKGRWILVREVSPYSSLLGRYPFGRGVLGRRSRFKTPLKFRYPAPRGNASEAPKSRLNCASPSARRRWRWAVRLRNGFSVGTGATRAARQHPSGRLRRCPSGSAYSQNRTRRFSAKQARRKTAPRVAAPSGDRYAVGGYALGFPPPAGVAPLFNERDDAAHDLPAKCRGVRRARPSAILAYRRESFPARGDCRDTATDDDRARGGALRFCERVRV